MAVEYLTDGDSGFIGLNSRDNPVSLPKGVVTRSENFRLNRGIASVRKGMKRLFQRDIDPGDANNLNLRYVTQYRNSLGQDLIVFICNSKLFTYNTSTGANSINSPISFPTTGGNQEVISATDNVDAFQALNKIYILRGYSKAPLVWDGATSVTVVPQPGTSHFPNSKHGVYFGNRAFVQTSSDEIAISHYLNLGSFSKLDVFKINDGSNDEIVAIAPWVLNEAVIFMRNKMYYASAGSGAYAAGDSVLAEDSYVKVMATDIGCVARRSIVQAAGGMIFLSDFGVYMITPQQATTPEGMRAGVLGEPISAPIEDVILRINKEYVHNACAMYHDNRYYLAVPVDNEPVGLSSPLIYINEEQVRIGTGFEFQDQVNVGDFVRISQFQYIDTSEVVPPGGSNTVYSFSGEYEVVYSENGIIGIDIPGFDYEDFEIQESPSQFEIQLVSRRNNKVLIFNIVNKSWESVDSFTIDMSVAFIASTLYKNRKRLMFVDPKKGLFLTEETKNGDEFGNSFGNPILDDVILPFFLEELQYTRKPVKGVLETRSYNFGNLDDKRYSSAEVDIQSPPGSMTKISVITQNPDVTTTVDIYGSANESDAETDSARDLPVRKIASSAKIRVDSLYGQPTIRSIYIQAVDTGNNTISKK
jgi:hypothetical protein